MPRIKGALPLREVADHLRDKTRNKGYDYEGHILENVLSPELFGNPMNDTPLRQLERLLEYLIDKVRLIKLTYAVAFPKNSKLIN